MPRISRIGAGRGAHMLVHAASGVPWGKPEISGRSGVEIGPQF